MSNRVPSQTGQVDIAPLSSVCPSWCVAPHGLHDGEEDWVHTSEPVVLTDRVLARICMTVQPNGEIADGPYVLIGSSEFTPAEANAVGLAIQCMASAAESTTRPAAPSMRSPGP